MVPPFCIAKLLPAEGQTLGPFSFLQIIAGGACVGIKALIALLMSLQYRGSSVWFGSVELS